MHEKMSIRIDRALGLVRIRMSGLLTLGDVRTFYDMRERAFEDLALPKNAQLTLNDVRDLKILPQETLAAFCDLLADPVYHSRRLAFVVAPTLVRAQVIRAVGQRPNVRCFTNPVEAESWLLGEAEQEAPRLRRAIG